ncbi:MAG: hypothetical protein O3B95_10085 [Chloroflexi bacterium]|nr:hypothetical protein [Chloroflexota bacterium]
MAETPTGKLHPIAKWSLVIGPILVVIFNFLLPTNGVDPVNPEDSKTFIAELGANADVAQIYMVIILLGIILYTRAIIGLWQVTAQNGVAQQRMGIGVLGGVAALSLWAVVIGLGLAEASVADKVVAATAGAQAGVAGAAESAAAAGTVASALHAAFFGIYQAATYVAYIALIPLGGGLAVGGIVRKEWGWAISLIGVATLILTSIFPVKTEEGIMIFGIIAVIWGVVFLAMGLQIMRQDMK